MKIDRKPTHFFRYWLPASILIALGLLGACVKTSLLDNPVPPPEDREIYYECIYHSSEGQRNGRWRDTDPLDIFIADQRTLGKCQQFSKNPGTCRRATCRWRLGTLE